MKQRYFLSQNSAVAGVLEAILLIGLVAIILSMIQLYYVPEIMQQKESDHMDQVSNQLAQLKSVIETQAMMGIIDYDETIAHTPMSSPLTLGSKELPYFVSARSYGTLKIIDQDLADDNIINIQPASVDFPSGIPLTSIYYKATNFYFPENIQPWQEYIFEGGGIILKQSNGEVMRGFPGINVENNSALGHIKIKYFIPIFDSIAGKKNYSSWRDCYVYTNYSKHYTHIGPATKIQIFSDYADAWYDCLFNESRGILWEYQDNGYINVQFDETVTPNKIEITPSSANIQLELTIAVISAQVGPGYVPN